MPENGPSWATGGGSSVRRLAVTATALFVLFAALAVAVAVHPAPFSVDQWWAETMASLRGDSAETAARILNAIGSFPLSLVIVLIAGLVLWRLRPRLDAATFLAAEAASWAIANLTKLAVSRPRPLDGLVDTSSASFPSGHTAFAAVSAVMLVGLCCTRDRRRGWALLAAALALTMAWSRTYLMVHWLTDVVAGLTVGAAVGFTALAGRAWLLERAAADHAERADKGRGATDE